MPEKKPHSRSFRLRQPKPPDPQRSPVCHLELMGELDDHVVCALRKKALIGKALSQDEADKP